VSDGESPVNFNPLPHRSCANVYPPNRLFSEDIFRVRIKESIANYIAVYSARKNLGAQHPLGENMAFWNSRFHLRRPKLDIIDWLIDSLNFKRYCPPKFKGEGVTPIPQPPSQEKVVSALSLSPRGMSRGSLVKLL